MQHAYHIRSLNTPATFFGPPVTPPSLPPAVGDRVLLGDSQRDNPNLDSANPALRFNWQNHGGDWSDANGTNQGTTPFATATAGAGASDVVFTCTALIQKLLNVENTGIYLAPVNPTPGFGFWEGSFAGNQYSDAAKRPRFHIVTNVGTFDVGASVTAWLEAPPGVTDRLAFPSVIKPNLTGVSGTVSFATLTLYNYATTGGNRDYGVFYLRMPTMVWEPARQLGGVENSGLASTVANEAELAAVALWYPELTPAADDWSFKFPGTQSVVLAHASTVTGGGWETYGLTALRLGSTALSEGAPAIDAGGIVAWIQAVTDREIRWGGSGPTIGLTDYTELYFRYLIKIDPDVAVGMVPSEAVKLPGFSSIESYGWNGANGRGYSYRLEHGGISPANPHSYRFQGQLYDSLQPIDSGQFANNNPFGDAVMRDARIYCVEQRVKMNTVTSTPDGGSSPGGPTYVCSADGILEIWMDGVKVFSDTARRIDNDELPAVIGTLFFNIFHGGRPTPLLPIHYEVAGVVVHTSYIGPPKPIAWTPPYSLPGPLQAVNIAQNTPLDVKPTQHTSSTWPFSLWRVYGGGAFVQDYSQGGAYVVAGSGGHSTSPNVGALIADFATGRFSYLSTGTSAENHTSDNFSITETNGQPWVEVTGSGGVPAPCHPYNSLIPLATAFGGGTKGSVVYVTRGAVCGNPESPTFAAGSHRMDLATGGWSRFSTNVFTDLAGRSGIAALVETSAIVDTARQRAWFMTNSQHSFKNFAYLDLSVANRGQFALTTPQFTDFLSSAAAGGLFFMQQGLLCYQSDPDPTKLMCYDQDDPLPGVIQLNVTGAALPTEAYAHGWQYFPPTGKFYKLPLNGGTTLWTLTPPASNPKTNAWTSDAITLSTSLPADKQLTVHLVSRSFSNPFFYVPALQMFGYIPGDNDSGMYVINPRTS